jgi:hypothetical protein
VNDDGDDNEEQDSDVSDKDFEWEDTSIYRGQSKLFIGEFWLQGATKGMSDILENFKLFCSKFQEILY